MSSSSEVVDERKSPRQVSPNNRMLFGNPTTNRLRIEQVPKVDLCFSVKNIPNRDALTKPNPLVLVERIRKSDLKGEVIGQTESISHVDHCDFATPVSIEYYFEKAEALRFTIYDMEKSITDMKKQDTIGSCEIVFGEILGSPTNSVSLNLKNKKGKLVGDALLIIRFNPVHGEDDKMLKIKLSAVNLDKKDFFGKSDPYFELHRVFKEGSTECVFRSDVIKNTLNPKWNEYDVSLMELCKGDFDKPFQIQVHDWDLAGKADLIGKLETTLNDLKKPCPILLLLLNELGKAAGRICFEIIEYFTLPNILDYINGGCKLQLSVAIDFSGSNGDPNKTGTLHHVDELQKNFYEKALIAVGNIVVPYDFDKKVIALGFGAKPPNQQEVSNCFPLSLKDDQMEVEGLEGLLKSYQQALRSVTLSGPSKLSSIIKAAIRSASEPITSKNQYYIIQLVLTDGEIEDMKESIEAIIDASKLPISIIIVGIGDGNFANMHKLDSDDRKLSTGKKSAIRDIVQFVRFESFSGDGEKLAAATLQEIPKQFLTFMKIKGMKPMQNESNSTKVVALSN